jgi:MFS family permease
MLTLARVLQGLGGGGLMTLSQALVGEAIPPRERARYQGYLAAVAVCANSFGPVAGGYLTEHFGWQSIFLINVPVGIGAAALVFRLPKPPAERLAWRADPGGVVLFTIFVAATLFSLEQFQRVNIADLPLGAALFAVGIVALVLLGRHESRTPSPLIPLALLRQPAIWHSDALAACHGAALVSLIVFLPVYLEVVRGASPTETGLMLVPLTIGIGFGSLVTGRLVSKTGLTTVFPIGGLLAVAACFLVLAFRASSLGTPGLAALMLLIGVFMGTVMGVVQVSVQSAAGRLRLGEAAASVQFSRSIGAAFGTALVATVLFAYLAIRNPDAARVFASMVEHRAQTGPVLSAVQRAVIQADIEGAFRAGFLLMAMFCVGGLLLALTNPQRRI